MDGTTWPQVREHLAGGQILTLTCDSAIYQGPYESEVLEVLDEGLRIRMPLESGRLVLIPVGTTLDLSFQGIAATWKAYVVDRRGGNERYLSLSVVQPEPKPAPEVAREPESTAVVKAPVVAVTSGKGGVGKSTVVLNLAIALAELGKRACVIDADLGTANVDVLLNLSPPYNLGDVVDGSKHMVEILVEGPKGMLVLPGGSGLTQLTRLHDDAFGELMKQFRALEEYADVILIDTGSGVAPAVTNFVGACSLSLLVTTPEPHAITDAYALLKVLAQLGQRVPMQMIINRVHNEAEGVQTADRMVYAARRFLQYELESLGFVHEDAMVSRAVRNQAAVILESPRSRASLDFRQLAEGLARDLWAAEKVETKARGGASDFLRRIRALLPARGRDEAFRA